MSNLKTINRLPSMEDYLTLPHGKICYAVHGAKDKNPVILVNGLVTPMFAWIPLADQLAAKGLRAIRYDHLGRGLSDCPQMVYTIEVFIKQLERLLSSLENNKQVDLVGWSMGGLICSYFAARYPDRVNKLVLVAPGFYIQKSLPERLFLKSPLFNLMMKKKGTQIILKALQGHFHEPQKFPEYFAAVAEQFRKPGMMAALISTMKNFPMGIGLEFEKLGCHHRQVLIVWGEQDKITPYRNASRIQALFKNSELFSVAQAGHAPHYEYPQKVNSKIVQFLGESDNI